MKITIGERKREWSKHMESSDDFEAENRHELSMEIGGNYKDPDTFDAALERGDHNDDIILIMTECYLYSIDPDNGIGTK